MYIKIVFISLIFILFSTIGRAQRNYIRFQHLSLEQGLSQGTVYDIVQDTYGFIWFVTEDGLNRYDGYEFRKYYYAHNNPKGISYKRLYSLLIDREGELWIGTLDGGLDKYNRATDDFTVYKHDKNNTNSISANVIQCLMQDNEGYIWIGTVEGGLNKFDKKTQKFVNWKNIPDNENSLTHNIVRSVKQDAEGYIWVATSGGLNRFDKKTNRFVRFKHNPDDANSLSDDELNNIFIDREDNIWIGSAKGGLDKFNKRTNQFEHFKNNPDNAETILSNQVTRIFEDSKGDLWVGTFAGLSRLTKENRAAGKFINYLFNPNDPYSLSNNYIRSIYEDRAGILWFGTYQDGVNKFDRNTRFVHYKNHVGNANSLINNSIRGFCSDLNGTVWIATYGDGFEKFDANTEIFKHYKHNKQNNNSLSEDILNSIVCDSEGFLWIGTQGGGLDKFDPRTEKFTHFKNDKQNHNSLSNNFVKSVFIDKSNIVWICTSGGGLNRFDRASNTFTHYVNDKNDPTSLADDKLNCITEASEGFLWIGTANKGVEKFDKQTGKFVHFRHSNDDSTSLSANRVFSIYISKTAKPECVLVGTAGGGINRIDIKTNKITCYTRLDGLANDIIYGILEDNAGNYWLSTNYGISRFNPLTTSKEHLFKNYDTKDGLQSNAFNEGAYFKAADGALYFGGVNGFNIFHPEKLKENTNIPPVFITDFRIFNESVLLGANSCLTKNILETDNIELSYKDYIFSFEFAALDYSNPERNDYLYMMEGFDKEWNMTDGTRRYATYTNLEPGDYTFKVKGSNNDGLWNPKAVEVKIKVVPPIWRTWWFRISSFLLVISLVFFYIRSKIRSLQKAKDILEQKVKERTAEIRQQKEEILSQSEQMEIANRELEKLSIVASETDNAVSIFDSNCDLEWVNAGYTKMFGYTLTEISRGEKLNFIKGSSNENIKEIINTCITQKKSISYESKSITKEGKKIWVQTTLNPIFDDFGKLKKLIAIDSDISIIKQAEQEILKKNEEIMAQKETLQRQNEDIKGSIRYAKTIQNAILPNQNAFDPYFESFIIYRPKDIVSGDFYWFTEVIAKSEELVVKSEELRVKREELRSTNEVEHSSLFTPHSSLFAPHSSLFIAVADCTGHGVPGAFMSMIGSRLLMEIVNEMRIYDPAEILTILDKNIKIALKQNESDNQDGMDIGLCRFEKQGETHHKLTFSGAKQSILYVKQNDGEISMIKGNRKIIGGSRISRNKESFTNQEVILQKDDLIYLFSDGIIDQNNSERKRYGTLRFLTTLKSVIKMPLDIQKQMIETDLEAYQKNESQRDDITLIGLKLI